MDTKTRLEGIKQRLEGLLQEVNDTLATLGAENTDDSFGDSGVRVCGICGSQLTWPDEAHPYTVCYRGHRQPPIMIVKDRKTMNFMQQSYAASQMRLATPERWDGMS